jgi:outer membrane protein OmpA-like peptidoglycan-associated protein
MAAMITVGALPGAAHEHGDMCDTVVNSEGNPVLGSGGNEVLSSASVPCPEEVAAVTRSVTEVEPAAGPVTLPGDGTIYFDLDSASLDDEGSALLADIAAALQAQNIASVTVSGYTDRSGEADYNMNLSEERAAAVAAALTDAGITDAAVSTEAMGETELAVETEDGVALRRNRRAVIATGS